MVELRSPAQHMAEDVCKDGMQSRAIHIAQQQHMLGAHVGVCMEHVGNGQNDQLLYECVMFYIEPLLSSNSEKVGP